MRCSISSEVHAAIVREVAAQPNWEVCGILLGREGVIAAHVAATNVAADPARSFEIDPAVLIAAFRQERSGGLPVIGYYHSHPHGPAVPSRVDAIQALPDGRLWLIAGNEELRAWRAVAGGAVHGRFDSVPLDISSVAAG